MLVFCICTYTVSIRMQRNAIKQVNAAPVLSAAEVLEQIGHERSRLLLLSFARFAPNGEMEARKFTKMLVSSGLTGPKFTTNDADIVFAKCKKYVADSNCASGVLKINYAAFEAVALEPIAEKLGISLSDVADALCNSQSPAQSLRVLRRGEKPGISFSGVAKALVHAQAPAKSFRDIRHGEKLGTSLSDVTDALRHAQSPAKSVRGIKRGGSVHDVDEDR